MRMSVIWSVLLLGVWAMGCRSVESSDKSEHFGDTGSETAISSEAEDTLAIRDTSATDEDTVNGGDTVSPVETDSEDSSNPLDSETETAMGSETENEADSSSSDMDTQNDDTDTEDTQISIDDTDTEDTQTSIDTDTEIPDSETPSDEWLPAERGTQPRALVNVIDNSLSLADSELALLYEQYPDELGSALAGLYNQPLSEIQSRSMTEIAEDFGEDWLIADVEKAADGHYDAYVSLTDAEATLDQFIEAIQMFSDAGYIVDILMDVHGTNVGEIIFFDGYYPVDDVTALIQSKQLNVSTVYQTVCWGEGMLGSWEAIGIHAINGTVGENMYVNFAPGAFLSHWIGGMGFGEAVEAARLEDMEEIRTRLTTAAEGNFELTLLLAFYDFEAQSTQIIAGETPEINW